MDDVISTCIANITVVAGSVIDVALHFYNHAMTAIASTAKDEHRFFCSRRRHRQSCNCRRERYYNAGIYFASALQFSDDTDGAVELNLQDNI
jgi:hypothetical protein